VLPSAGLVVFGCLACTCVRARARARARVFGSVPPPSGSNPSGVCQHGHVFHCRFWLLPGEKLITARFVALTGVLMSLQLRVCVCVCVCVCVGVPPVSLLGCLAEGDVLTVPGASPCPQSFPV
jgi:hypothetical protein